MRLKLKTPATFQDEFVPKGTQLAGWAALVQALGLQSPVRQPSCVSEKYILGSQRTEGGFRVFDKRYQPGDQFTDHLTFALRHENIDLLLLKRAFEAVPKTALEAYVRATPTGTHTRRAWFFYETLTGQTLDVDDAANVKAVDALDPKAYFTGKAKLSRRHKVRDNLLGSGDWCPVIRRTEELEAFTALGLADRAAETVGRTGQHLVTRAASFLLLADSRASFEIEGERAPRSRLERWGKAVLQAGKNALTLEEITRLHSVLIEDTRFVSRACARMAFFSVSGTISVILCRNSSVPGPMTSSYCVPAYWPPITACGMMIWIPSCRRRRPPLALSMSTVPGWQRSCAPLPDSSCPGRTRVHPAGHGLSGIFRHAGSDQ